MNAPTETIEFRPDGEALRADYHRQDGEAIRISADAQLNDVTFESIDTTATERWEWSDEQGVYLLGSEPPFVCQTWADDELAWVTEQVTAQRSKV